MGDCVDQGNGYYACMPKTPAAKKGKATKQMKTTKEKPKSEEEELMDEMTGTDMTMHPFTYREVNVGYASGVMVLAVTNTGKLQQSY